MALTAERCGAWPPSLGNDMEAVKQKNEVEIGEQQKRLPYQSIRV
jgi:hypothetical protein